MKLTGPRPTFGVGPTAAPAITKDNDERKEIGAIWKKTTKTNRSLYNVKLNIPKAKLQEMLAATEGDTVKVSLVGFDNDFHKGDDTRPIYRLYEDRK